jgi:hypothetical protein
MNSWTRLTRSFCLGGLTSAVGPESLSRLKGPVSPLLLVRRVVEHLKVEDAFGDQRHLEVRVVKAWHFGVGCDGTCRPLTKLQTLGLARLPYGLRLAPPLASGGAADAVREDVARVVEAADKGAAHARLRAKVNVAVDVGVDADRVQGVGRPQPPSLLRDAADEDLVGVHAGPRAERLKEDLRRVQGEGNKSAAAHQGLASEAARPHLPDEIIVARAEEAAGAGEGKVVAELSKGSQGEHGRSKEPGREGRARTPRSESTETMRSRISIGT